MTSPTRATARANRAGTATAPATRASGAATLVEVGGNKHNGEVSDFSAIREIAQRRALPHRRFRASSPTNSVGGFGRDLIDRARQQGDPGSVQRSWRQSLVQGRGRVEPLATTSATPCTSTAQGFTTSGAVYYRAPASPPAQIAAGGWTGPAVRRRRHERLQRVHPHG